MLTPAGVALLAYGLVGLLDGRWAAYGAGGASGAAAPLGGVLTASEPRQAEAPARP